MRSAARGYGFAFLLAISSIGCSQGAMTADSGPDTTVSADTSIDAAGDTGRVDAPSSETRHMLDGSDDARDAARDVSGCLADGSCAPCAHDYECQDGVYCNGYEVCVRRIDASAGDARGCAPGVPIRCAGTATCNESRQRCVNVCGGDDMPLGSGGTGAGGSDAGASGTGGGGGDAGPLCTRNQDCADGLFCTGVETCQPGTIGSDLRGCVPANSPCTTGMTCDEDTDACRTAACATSGDRDRDGDGVDSVACGGSDCDDMDRTAFPGNVEVCDPGHDEDCNPCTVQSIGLDGDRDTDGFISDRCSNLYTGGIAPTCDPRLFAGGGVVRGQDCDDSTGTIAPNQNEICDERDQNCNQMVDEGLTTLFYRDIDGDLFGVGTCGKRLCAADDGYVTNTNDCDDANGALFSGSAICDWMGENGVRRCDRGLWTDVTPCTTGQFCVTDSTTGAGSCVSQ